MLSRYQKLENNVIYFWVKMFFTAIVFLLWVIDSDMFYEKSSVHIAIAMIISALTLVLYGIIFKNEFNIRTTLLIFLSIDILVLLFLILPVFYTNILFSLFSIVLFAAVVFLLEQRDKVIILSAYLVLSFISTYINSDNFEGSRAGSVFFYLVIFSVVSYLIFHIILHKFKQYEARVQELEKEKQKLELRHKRLDKEIKLSSQRLEFMNRDLRKKSFEIQNILTLTDQLGDKTDSKGIISSFLLTMVGQLGSSHALYLGKNNSNSSYYRVLEQKGIHDEHIKNLRIYNDSFFIQLLKSTKDPVLIKNIPLNQLYKDEQELLKLFHNDLISPIKVRNNIIGMFIIGEKITGDIFTREDSNLVSIITNQAAFILEQSKANDEIYEFYNKTMKTIVRAQELKDVYSKGHAIRTAHYVQSLGIKLGISNDELRNMIYGTLLHDVGKIAVKDEILMYNKKIGNENADVKKKILEHTLMGGSILKSVGFDTQLVDMALHHHEWFNGNGFPHNLKKTQISLGSRILSVCNAFDAMLMDKPYRKSFEKEWTIDQIKKMSGHQFDPEIVTVFVDEIDSNPKFIKIPNRH